MFEVLLQFLLMVISIISVLLMTLQNSHGFILWSIEPRLSAYFSKSKNMLSDSLAPKFDVFSLIGVGNTRNFTINFLLLFGSPNENTITLLSRVLLY
jgi:hypothetical protein